MAGPFATESMRAQTRPLCILSSESCWQRNRSPDSLLRKNPLYRTARGGPKPRRYITQDSESNALPTELFRAPHSPSICHRVSQRTDARVSTIFSQKEKFPRHCTDPETLMRFCVREIFAYTKADTDYGYGSRSQRYPVVLRS